MSDTLDAFPVTLRDGTPLVLRRLRRSDRRRLAEGMKELSVQSRLQRFFTPLLELSKTQLDYLTRLDQMTHVAWVALTPLEKDEAGQSRGVGVGRFARDDDEAHQAEFALTVVDDYQGRGLGAALLAALYVNALRLGIHTLSGQVLARNDVLKNWLVALGATVHPQGEAVRIDLPVEADRKGLGATASGRRFRALTRKVEAAMPQ